MNKEELSKYKSLISSPEKINILLARSMFVLSKKISLKQFCKDVVISSFNRKYVEDYTPSKYKVFGNQSAYYFWSNVVDDFFIDCTPNFSICLHTNFDTSSYMTVQLSNSSNDFSREFKLDSNFLKEYWEFQLLDFDQFELARTLSVMKKSIVKCLEEHCNKNTIEVYKTLVKNLEQ